MGIDSALSELESVSEALRRARAEGYNHWITSGSGARRAVPDPDAPEWDSVRGWDGRPVGPPSNHLVHGPRRQELRDWLGTVTNWTIWPPELTALGDPKPQARLSEVYAWMAQHGFEKLWDGELLPGVPLALMLHPSEGMLAQLGLSPSAEAEADDDPRVTNINIRVVVEPVDPELLAYSGQVERGGLTETDSTETGWILYGSVIHSVRYGERSQSYGGSLQVALAGLRAFSKPVVPWPVGVDPVGCWLGGEPHRPYSCSDYVEATDTLVRSLPPLAELGVRFDKMAQLESLLDFQQMDKRNEISQAAHDQAIRLWRKGGGPDLLHRDRTARGGFDLLTALIQRQGAAQGLTPETGLADVSLTAVARQLDAAAVSLDEGTDPDLWSAVTNDVSVLTRYPELKAPLHRGIGQTREVITASLDAADIAADTEITLARLLAVFEDRERAESEPPDRLRDMLPLTPLWKPDGSYIDSSWEAARADLEARMNFGLTDPADIGRAVAGYLGRMHKARIQYRDLRPLVDEEHGEQPGGQ